ncbi:MAG: hypothetical protein MK085_02325 [Phycisphaerales bacterium]|nr:hypothetical protein [Phycisphaerales bacterium]
MKICSTIVMTIAGIGLASIANAQDITVDGFLDNAYGDARAIQNTATGFGNAQNGQVDFCDGSELDGGFGVIQDGHLHLFFSGNLESNFNHLEVFIDSVPGVGQNTILNNNPDIDLGALGNMGTYGAEGDKDYAQGLTFDEGFVADFWVDLGCGNDPFEFYLNYSGLLTGGGTDVDNGFAGPGFGGAAGVVTTKNGISAAIDNSNVAGVEGCDGLDCPIGDGPDGSGVFTGMEIKIPLAVLNYTEGDALKVTAFINNNDHFYVSNQFLPGINGFGNLAYSRQVNLAGIDGDQFFSVVECEDCPSGCEGDFNDDNIINGADFGLMLSAWGSCTGCPEDLNGDNEVNGADVGLILALWGDCPEDPGGGGEEDNCDVPHDGPGCSNTACETIVCAIDPLCCVNDWDQVCADLAIANCDG